MFGISKETQIESTSNNTSLEPGIYRNMKLVKVKAAQAVKKDKTKGKKMLEFHFEQIGTGKVHVHTEWETNDAKKAANLSKRVSHILTKVGVDRSVLENSLPTFVKYIKYIEKVFNGVITEENNPLIEIKVLGSVYNNKKYSGFPNYVGFVALDGFGLTFSAKEKEGNEEYAKFNPDAADDEEIIEESADDAIPSGGATSEQDDDDDLFDDDDLPETTVEGDDPEEEEDLF